MFFTKKSHVRFIPAICPTCKGPLELDTNMEIAYCPKCGTRCIIDENINKNSKLKTIDKIIGYAERQQNIRRAEERKKEEEEKLQQEKNIIRQNEEQKSSKYICWIILIISLIIIIIMAIIEIKGEF